MDQIDSDIADDLPPLETGPEPPRWLRLVAFLFLLCAVITAGYFAFFTPYGHKFRHPETLKASAQFYVSEHAILAASLLLCAYLVFGLSGLPVWWIQALAGAGFGVFRAVILCQASATLTAVCSIFISRWLVGQWFHSRVEARLKQVRALDETLGHNGFLVVMAIRLAHVVPFGVSNYVMGLTTISIIDVALGTYLASAPAITFYVTFGSNPQQLVRARFWLSFAAMHVVLLIPLLLRYLRPNWFRKIGIE